MEQKILHKGLSEQVLGAAFTVHNALGPGLLESAYEGAMAVELKHVGRSFQRQVVYPLEYRGEYCSAYIADMVIAGKILLELKSGKEFTPVINYLKLSGIPVGYLINFNGCRVEWKRFVCGSG